MLTTVVIIIVQVFFAHQMKVNALQIRVTMKKKEKFFLAFFLCFGVYKKFKKKTTTKKLNMLYYSKKIV